MSNIIQLNWMSMVCWVSTFAYTNIYQKLKKYASSIKFYVLAGFYNYFLIYEKVIKHPFFDIQTVCFNGWEKVWIKKILYKATSVFINCYNKILRGQIYP